MNQSTSSPDTETVEATKKCPDCLADIPKAAKKCSHCGKKQKQNITMLQLIVVSTIFISIIASVLNAGNSTSSSVEQGPITPTGQQAFIISQNFVTQALKSPSTADFPSSEYNYHLVGEKTHVITSYVDSENSFGAMLRSKWTVSMTFNGGDWADQNNWTLETLVVNDEDVYVRKN